MKKIDLKSLAVGILLCTVFFLFVNASSNNYEIGRYRVVLDGVNKIIYDTTTGEMKQFWCYDDKNKINCMRKSFHDIPVHPYD